MANLISYGETLGRTPDELKKLFRSLENLYKKAVGRRWCIRFNKVCISVNFKYKHFFFQISQPSIYTFSNIFFGTVLLIYVFKT